MKRVLIFSLAYYPHVGGAEVAVREITNRINDIAFDMVTLRWSKDEPAEELIGNVHVYRIGRGGVHRISKLVFQFHAALVASALHKKNKYDAIWALMAHSAGVPAALFKWRYPSVPYILNLQEGDPLPSIERTMRPVWPLFVRAFTSATIIQPLSAYLAQWARHMGYQGRIEIIPNGVDLRRFVGSAVPHAGTVLITTSRLVQKNAVDDVIRALPLLPATVSFKILGIGPDDSALRELAKSENVSDRVSFLGHVDHSDLPKYLHEADIFIRPSRSEGQGASFMEAMGAGLPVIATQEGGIADFLFDAKRNPDKPTTGWAVDKDSPNQIAEAVRDIMDNPEKVQKVIETAREMVIKKYDWDLVAKDMREKVFASLL